VVAPWKGAIINIENLLIPRDGDRSIIKRAIILTAIRIIKPATNAIFFENIKLRNYNLF